jgi:transposase
LPAELSDAVLEERLFADRGSHPGRRRHAEPEWAVIHGELKRPGVTLMLLWVEYREREPDGYAYSRFCELYAAWRVKLAPTMRQSHVAGDKLFVDYAGQTIDVIDPRTGEVHAAQLFVAVLGASSYTYAEATWTQTLPDWIGAHVRAFDFFGAVPRLIVPDNPKTAVLRACFYEPDLQATYREMASHYGVALLPARPYRPRDKAKVEAGVLVVERWILARLRNRRFFSLAELNAAIVELVAWINARVNRRLRLSRRDLFDRLERPAMRPLPVEAYVFAQTIEIFHKSARVAAHLRSFSRGHHTTIPEHMPSAHRRYADWTPERLHRDAGAVGTKCAALIDAILRTKPHPEQGFRAAIGILRLARVYGRERLEAASARALAIDGLSYRSVASFLKHGLDRAKTSEASADAAPLFHPNLRGPGYYH